MQHIYSLFSGLKNIQHCYGVGNEGLKHVTLNSSTYMEQS